MPLPGLDLRDGINGLVGFARKDLDALWRQVSTAAEAKVALHDVLPALIATYGAAAGVLAANWYDELRIKADPKGQHFTATPADIADPGTDSLIGWATDKATDPATLQVLVLGGMQRRIANFSRATVTSSSLADPGARGWQRTGSGECAFCAMLIGRGAVYSEDTADFASHDHCNCSAVPVFDGEPRPVKSFTPSLSDSTDADRARVRDWIASH